MERSRLPVCLRIVLESLLNYDGKKIQVRHYDLGFMETERRAYCGDSFYCRKSVAPRLYRRPPWVDLAAMRSAVARMGRSPEIIEPLVPVNLVIDSVQVDFANQADAFKLNLEMEFKRNRSRYEFLKWCIVLQSFNVVPPGIGICHQVNLEYLLRCLRKAGLLP